MGRQCSLLRLHVVFVNVPVELQDAARLGPPSEAFIDPTSNPNCPWSPLLAYISRYFSTSVTTVGGHHLEAASDSIAGVSAAGRVAPMKRESLVRVKPTGYPIIHSTNSALAHDACVLLLDTRILGHESYALGRPFVAVLLVKQWGRVQCVCVTATSLYSVSLRLRLTPRPNDGADGRKATVDHLDVVQALLLDGTCALTNVANA